MDEVEKAKLKLELRNLRKKKSTNAHSVNFYLLMMIIVLLVAMVAATLYFFWRHGTVLEENKEFVDAKSMTDDRLNECRANLNDYADRMKALKDELNATLLSKGSLSELYLNLSDLKSAIEANLTNTKSSLSACNLQVSQVKNERDELIGELNMEINKYNQLLASTNRTITLLKDDIANLEAQINIVKANLKDIRECVEDSNCSACEDY